MTDTSGPMPSAWERFEGAIERAREAAPSLTGGLVIATLVVGIAIGAIASKPVHRWQVNREWRAKLAEKGVETEAILSAADDDDDAIIEEIGGTYARLHRAENDLRNASRPWASTVAGDCRIPRDRLH